MAIPLDQWFCPLLATKYKRFSSHCTYSYKPDLQIYLSVWGRNKKVRDHFNELTLELQEKSGDKRLINLIFRAYENGIAFRYQLPQTT